MAVKKKKKATEVTSATVLVVTHNDPASTTPVIPTKIEKVSVDYPSEGLNNLAIKVNEIIDRLNENR